MEPEDDFLVPNGFLEVLRLEFHDATDKEGVNGEEFYFTHGKNKGMKAKLKLFNEEMAKKILAFLNKNSDNNILIHCRAGISRSAAVARFASELLDREPVGLAVPTTQFANAWVLAILNRERWK